MSQKVHAKTAAQWDTLESSLSQKDMFSAELESASEEQTPKKKRKSSATRHRRKRGFISQVR